MRLIVFDCDGTLVDSQQTIITATEAALSSHDFAAPDRRDILYAVGLPVEERVLGRSRGERSWSAGTVVE